MMGRQEVHGRGNCRRLMWSVKAVGVGAGRVDCSECVPPLDAGVRAGIVGPAQGTVWPN